MAEIYQDGPLQGMAHVDCLIDARATKILSELAQEHNVTLDDVVRNAVEEYAIDIARRRNISYSDL
ncbi:MAG: hypothetical protein K5905_19025 [Roseibium sp.]|uniref:hypothetical protein n=1 Tax=Roseibium sp. TaxID=1936156 RepID=UPI002612F691|nr:hypothetical protein [Roseibium sp.]MCV0427557.1 hypothetical protein [Roseibium sp.]